MDWKRSFMTVRFVFFFSLSGFILHLIGGNTMDMSKFKSKCSWIFNFHIKYTTFNINALPLFCLQNILFSEGNQRNLITFAN